MWKIKKEMFYEYIIGNRFLFVQKKKKNIFIENILNICFTNITMNCIIHPKIQLKIK